MPSSCRANSQVFAFIKRMLLSLEVYRGAVSSGLGSNFLTNPALPCRAFVSRAFGTGVPKQWKPSTWKSEALTAELPEKSPKTQRKLQLH
ncbi:MAG: hypothetical protein JWN74_2368 [Acidobacteriaceae bacterium]|nr:hypothetical protein [Acidobacteriaceae bacterium]